MAVEATRVRRESSDASGGLRPSPYAGLVWMALASTLFAAMNLVGRLASAAAPWPEVAAARSLVGVLVAAGIGLARGKPLRMRNRRGAWARSLCGSAAMVCFFYSISSPDIPLGDAVTLGSTTPVFVALLSPWLLGERSTWRTWAALGGALVGAALVAGPTFHVAGHVAVAATLASVFSALSMISLRRLGTGSGPSPEGAEAIVLHFSLVSSCVMGLLAIPVFRAPDAQSLVLLGATGLAGGLAQLAMTRAYALEHATRLGPLGYLNVVMSHLAGAVVLAETTTGLQLAGSVMVVGAGVLLAASVLRERGLSPGGAVGE